MRVQILSRLIVGAALVLACMAYTNTGRSTASSTPAVPLISYHHAFDHHWYVWLPRHPTYEAVEVMTIDAPYNPYRLVWVFFTEREGEKRQHHFMDDPRIAEGADHFHYRKIDYRRTGESGAGQSVHVSLTGLDGVPFEVEIDAEGVPLTQDGAGLTNQSGHGAERVVMLFHRKRSARTEHNRVVIGGTDFSFRAGDDPEGEHRFMAAYSAGIQIVVFPFGQWTFRGDETRLGSEAAGFSFTVEGRENGVALVSDLLGYDNRTTIELDADGALERYRHDVGSNRMVISLEEPLPFTGPAPQSASRFSVLMDPEEPVASGRVVSEPTESGRRLSWTIDTPSWAAGYPFESLVEERDGGMTLTIRSTRHSN
ncbi:MAG: hypothetical protein OXI57_00335 [Rhodospirillales bacterium]|nr:hypothetical protein [Rhodospirillales bacterium]